MITSTAANKYAVVRSFGSSPNVGLSFFFLLEDLEMLKNLEVFIFWSEKSSAITTSFESYFELVSYSLEIANEST